MLLMIHFFPRRYKPLKKKDVSFTWWYPDNCPNGHNPERHDPEWTQFRNGHNPEWTQSRKNRIPNGHNPEMDTIPKGHNPKMNTIPNEHLPS